MCIITSSFYDYLTDKYKTLYIEEYKNKQINLDKYRFKFVNVNDYCVEHNLDKLLRSTYNVVEYGVSISYFFIKHWSDNEFKMREYYIEETKSGKLVMWRADMQSNIIEGSNKNYENLVYFIDDVINKTYENGLIDKDHILFSGLDLVNG